MLVTDSEICIMKSNLSDCSPLFGIRVHTDATYDYGSTTATYAPDSGPSGVCLDFTHVPCNQL